MQGTLEVQVVLGEGQPGILRSILEAQGFHVVGHARGDDELRTILDLTDPTVIVLDAGISAIAAADTRVRAPRAPIVVVWPQGTFTPLAEERVEPNAVILELGNAVRRAAEHHLSPGPVVTLEAVDDLEPAAEVEPVDDVAPAGDVAAPTSRRRRATLVGAVAWTLALTALATIAVALPSFLDGDAGSLHPSGGRRPLQGFTQDREATAIATAPGRPVCEPTNGARGRGVGRRNGNDRSSRSIRPCSGAHRGEGAAGRGHGRPADPGPSDRGKRSGRGSGPSHEGSGGDSTHGPKGARSGQDGPARDDDGADRTSDGPSSRPAGGGDDDAPARSSDHGRAG